MLSTELSTAAAYIALALAVVSFIAAYGCFHFCMRVARSERDYRALLLFIQELDDNHEALAASHKRLRSRVGMRDLRARRNESKNEPGDHPELPQPSRDQEEWKRQMRVKLHTGQLKP